METVNYVYFRGIGFDFPFELIIKSGYIRDFIGVMRCCVTHMSTDLGIFNA